MSEIYDSTKTMKEFFKDYESLKVSFQQDTLIELLKRLQEEFGSVPKEFQELISEEFGIKLGVIQSVIKRFPSLTEYPYKHRIIVCMGQQCTSKNSEDLWGQIKEELKKRPNNLFYLTKQYCFHKCATAPNIKIDNDFYTNVSQKDISSILDNYN